MIAQISYNREESYVKDFNESRIFKLTISGIDKTLFSIFTELLAEKNINFSKINNSVPAKLNIELQESKLTELLNSINNDRFNDLYSEINTSFRNYKNYDLLSVKLREKELPGPVIMGILNVTPDSFSDGGKYFDHTTAVNYAIEMINSGADIIDVGGESTRPESEPVKEEEELNRVIPVIEKILEKKPDAVISVDTTKSKVALEACKRGAKIINDISGLTFDPDIAYVASEYSASLIIMHIKGTPETMQKNPVYDDLIFEIYSFLYNQTGEAKKAGVKNIIIDPGIGFGKKIEHNFEILKRLSDFKYLGYPVLIGISRKSFLGKTLNLGINERDTATVIAETIAIRNGAKIIRTHNVSNALSAVKILKHIYTV